MRGFESSLPSQKRRSRSLKGSLLVVLPAGRQVYVAHSSSGPGHRPLKAETGGSNPPCATKKTDLMSPLSALYGAKGAYQLWPCCGHLAEECRTTPPLEGSRAPPPPPAAGRACSPTPLPPLAPSLPPQALGATARTTTTGSLHSLLMAPSNERRPAAGSMHPETTTYRAATYCPTVRLYSSMAWLALAAASARAWSGSLPALSISSSPV